MKFGKQIDDLIASASGAAAAIPEPDAAPPPPKEKKRRFPELAPPPPSAQEQEDAAFAERFSQLSAQELAMLLRRNVAEAYVDFKDEASALLSGALRDAMVDSGQKQAKRALDWAQTIIGEDEQETVEGFLTGRTLMLLGGKPKSGKSLMAIDMAACIAEGTPVFDRYPVVQSGPVLYLCMEDPPGIFKARLGKRGILMKNLDVYVHHGLISLGTPTGMAELRDLVDAMPQTPVLVIVDTIRAAMFDSVENWNDAGTVTRAMVPLMEFAHTVCGVLMVAHNRKSEGVGGDKISGSNALQSIVDGYYLFGKDTEKGDGKLEAELEIEDRARPSYIHTVMMDGDSQHWAVLSDAQAQEKYAAERQAYRNGQNAQVARCFEPFEGATRRLSQLSDMTGISLRQVRTITDEMVEACELARLDEKAVTEAGRQELQYAMTERGVLVYMSGAAVAGSDETTAIDDIELEQI